MAPLGLEVLAMEVQVVLYTMEQSALPRLEQAFSSIGVRELMPGAVLKTATKEQRVRSSTNAMKYLLSTHNQEKIKTNYSSKVVLAKKQSLVFLQKSIPT